MNIMGTIDINIITKKAINECLQVKSKNTMASIPNTKKRENGEIRTGIFLPLSLAWLLKILFTFVPIKSNI